MDYITSSTAPLTGLAAPGRVSALTAGVLVAFRAETFPPGMFRRSQCRRPLPVTGVSKRTVGILAGVRRKHFSD
jgi:hypothetical protein